MCSHAALPDISSPSPANQRHSLPASLPYRSRTAATVIGAPMTYGQG
eukprot:CAMPEP_0172198230 /NCGR_PEP_ID=MMETSP1050-20130122/27960_1 /TAXON_ID=233186 /ORGANISM="Cryptomonas curvata, Strain CCAP979/52" /LENGTH=46 /DNA_ID= /DNA_START= /DNA_END= /DNA_ORIENTATION=